MSKYLSVSAKQISSDSSSATYECTVSRTNGAYFGYCDYNRCLAIKKASGYYKYWGFPTTSSWRSSWGTPSWYLQSSGRYINNQFGNLDGFLATSYTWQERVSIDRGKSRQGSKYIEVGVVSGSGINSDFGTTLFPLTLKTTQIPDATNSWLDASVDPITVRNRYITIKGGFTNPEGYYNMKLYRNGIQVSFDGTYTEQVTKDKFFSSIVFTLKVFGKDGTLYKPLTKEKTVYIEPSGVGVSVQKNSTYGVNSMYLNNVTHKEITEVWIKKNGKIYKTEK